ncbi:MAG TPA: FecR domain-containing protein [Puia sp.]|nr:FecR domain-containing protein [Puia sp.]
MDSLPIYDNLPWETIASALQGTLSADEDLRFREWLALSPDNQHTYDRLQQIWKDKLADYAYYREADEEKAWEALQRTMFQHSGGKVASMSTRWLAAAAILLLVVGAGWWYLSRKSAGILYETALEQKKLSLPDGSTIVISPETRIRVASDYNKTGRTVVLSAGEAHFEVSHQSQLPFTVDADVVTVKDIGTSFSVQKTADSIKVTVTAGKVAFLKKETGESRELSAGSSLTYYNAVQRFGDIRSTGSSISSAGSLRFDNTPLFEIIAALQKMSGKKISLSNAALGQKRLTVHLDGESVDNAVNIICASLNLESTVKDDIYILSSRDSVIHNY